MACEDKSLRAKMPFSLRTSPFALCPSMQRCIPNEISLSQKTKNYALADAKLYVGGCKALRWRLQSFALAIAKLCVGGCNALRWQMQCFALR